MKIEQRCQDLQQELEDKQKSHEAAIENQRNYYRRQEMEEDLYKDQISYLRNENNSLIRQKTQLSEQLVEQRLFYDKEVLRLQKELKEERL